jgi:hypothetical protein
VFFDEGLQKLEVRAKSLREHRAVVSFDRQTAASLGAFQGERRHDDISPDPERSSNGVQVRFSINIFGQEVKDSPVVPHVDLLR